MLHDHLSSLTPRATALLDALHDAIVESPTSLVSTGVRATLRERHLPECVAFAAHLDLPEDGRVLDVGSGGGLPGLVIAIVRDEAQVTLVESRSRKANFLIDFAEAHDLAVDVLQTRVEIIDEVEAWGLVTARAVAPLERLIPWCARLLRPGGVIAAIKGDRWPTEVEAAQAVMDKWDVEVTATPSDPGTAVVGPVEACPHHPQVVMLRRSATSNT